MSFTGYERCPLLSDTNEGKYLRVEADESDDEGGVNVQSKEEVEEENYSMK
jgi:hypothetical protein